MEVTLLNRQRGCRVPRGALQTFLGRLTRELPAPDADSVAVCLVSDRRMRELNRTYRRRNETTDVLSFPAGPVPAGCGERHLGDIVISVETARRQATRARHSLGTELKILALHGYLHLLGHDHEADDGAMLRLQRALTRRLVGPGRGRTAS